MHASLSHVILTRITVRAALLISLLVISLFGGASETWAQANPAARPVAIAGSVSSAFNVTSEGDSMFALPVSVPPGTAGLTPSITLAYSSRRQNGLLGVGWALGGLSVISRCEAALVPDGVSDPVDFDGNDRFCIDGARLIPLRSVSGGTEYRTEIDTFQQIFSRGASGVGPEWFEVRTKDGRILEFGRTTDARVQRADGSAVVWGVSRLSDRAGNFARFRYRAKGSGAMLALDRVEYSGNDAANVAPHASVRFVYESRPDVRDMYGPTGLTTISIRLAQVQTFVGESLVRRYVLSYVPSSSTGRSLLFRIQECAVDFDRGQVEECGLPTGLGYTSRGLGANQEVAIADFPGGLDQGLDSYVDVNGDGTADLVFYDAQGRFQVATSAGTRFNPATVWLASQSAGPPAQTEPVFGDLDGDGLVDAFLKNRSGNLFGYRSDGLRFGPQRTLASFPAGESVSIFADFNGDGRDDFLNRVADNRVFLHYSSGDLLAPGQLVHQVPVGTQASEVEVEFPDVNGDGVPDLAYRDGTCLYVIRWSEGSFEPFRSGKCARVLLAAQAQLDIYFADVNGDGKSDLIQRPKGTNTFQVSLSDGENFLAPVQWAARPAGDYLDAGQVQFPDFNADGLADLMYRTRGSVFSLQLSTGRGFGAPIDLLTTTGSRANNQAQFVDTDGDGMAEINFRFGDNRYASFRNADGGGLPDMLSFIVEGDGRETELRWGALTDPTLYAKGSGAEFPIVDVQPAQYVVESVSTSDGAGGVSTRRFFYSGLRRLLERGEVLGFREVAEVDESRGSRMITRYRQDFPLNGMEESVRMVDPSGRTRMRVSSTYQFSQDSAIFRVRLVERKDEAFEPDGSLVVTRTTEQQYDSFNNPTVVRSFASDGVGSQTTTRYRNDPSSWLIGLPEEVVVNAFAPGTPNIERTTLFEYDASRGLRTREIREPSTEFELSKRFVYDPFGNVIVTRTEGVDIETRESRVSYSLNGRFPTRATNPLGQSVVQGFDQRFASPTSVTDANGARTEIFYDSLGREIARLFPDGTSSGTQFGRCGGQLAFCSGVPGSRFVRTAQAGQPTTVVVLDVLDREVRKGVMGFDGRWIFQDTRYDSAGRVARRSLEYFADQPARWIEIEYDFLDRVVRQTEPDGSETTVAYAGLTTVTTNALGQTKTEIRNSQDQILEAVDAMGSRQRFTYDAFGNVTSVRDPNGNVIRTDYDRLGRKLLLDDPDLGITQYAYDALGQVIAQMDAKGQVSSFVYDTLGRPLFRSEAGGTTEFIYDIAPDGIGKLAAAIGQQGDTTHVRRYAYDAFGRPLATELTVEGRVYYVINGYDELGRVSEVTYPSGFQVVQSYNSSGYLLSVANLVTGQTYWTGVQRDAGGRFTEERFGNNLVTRNVFNPLTLQLERVQTGSGQGSSVQNLRYSWDRLANLTRREDLNRGKSEQFEYDRLNRLTRAQVTGVPAQVFAYDRVGNIRSKSDVGTYAYGQNAGPHAVTATVGDVSQFYTYDPNGNQVARFDAAGIQTAAFVYAAFNKPIFLTTDGGSRWSELLYGEDRDFLVRRDFVVGSRAVSATYFVEGIFEEVSTAEGATERRHYVRGGDRTIAVVTDAGAGTAQKTRYLHRDHLGSVDTITDQAGTVVESLSYDAFGKRRNPDWTPASTRLGSSLTKGYTGHEQLDHLGLVHMGGRVYDPTLGRFMSADPFVQFPTDTQGFNRYAYVNNNPLAFVDPSGFGLSRFFKSVGKFFQRLLGVVGKITKVIGFIRSLACLASFGIGCVLTILSNAISVAFEFGLAPKTRFNTGRTGRLIGRVGAVLAAGGASQRPQKITGIGGEVDIDVGFPSVFDQWSRRMRPDGVIFNLADDDPRSKPNPLPKDADAATKLRAVILERLLDAARAAVEAGGSITVPFSGILSGEESQDLAPVGGKGIANRVVSGRGDLTLSGVKRVVGTFPSGEKVIGFEGQFSLSGNSAQEVIEGLGGGELDAKIEGSFQAYPDVFFGGDVSGVRLGDRDGVPFFGRKFVAKERVTAFSIAPDGAGATREPIP